MEHLEKSLPVTVQSHILRPLTLLPVRVHDTTVEPVTVDEVRVDLSTVDFPTILDEVKVDAVTVESFTLVSVNVEPEVWEFIHVELVAVFPVPEQSTFSE